MTQQVFFPANNIAASSGTLSGHANNTNNQEVADDFSGFLAAQGGAVIGEQPLGNPLHADVEGGQDLPLEQLDIADDGETLPLPVPGLELNQDTSRVKPTISKVLAKDDTQLIPVATLAPAASEVSANTVLPDAATIQALSQGPLSKHAVQLEQAVPGNRLLEQSLRLQQSVSPSSSTEVVSHAANGTIDAEAQSMRLQANQSAVHDVLQPVNRPVDPAVVTHTLRRMVTPVSGGETRTGSELVAALAAGQSGSVSTQPALQGLAGMTLNTPMQNAGWSQELTDKIQWMVGQRLQGAQIKLNPAHLGPMEVKIQMQNDQATIHFIAAHSVVREALEAAMPRLREMFDNQGVQLGDVDVSEESFARQRQDRESSDTRQAAGPAESRHFLPVDEQISERWETPVSAPGRLDLFV